MVFRQLVEPCGDRRRNLELPGIPAADSAFVHTQPVCGVLDGPSDGFASGAEWSHCVVPMDAITSRPSCVGLHTHWPGGDLPVSCALAIPRAARFRIWSIRVPYRAPPRANSRSAPLCWRESDWPSFLASNVHLTQISPQNVGRLSRLQTPSDQWVHVPHPLPASPNSGTMPPVRRYACDPQCPEQT